MVELALARKKKLPPMKEGTIVRIVDVPMAVKFSRYKDLRDKITKTLTQQPYAVIHEQTTFSDGCLAYYVRRIVPEDTARTKISAEFVVRTNYSYNDLKSMKFEVPTKDRSGNDYPFANKGGGIRKKC